MVYSIKITSTSTRLLAKNNKQISDEDLRKLIQHFNRMNLRDDNLSSPTWWGAAYEYHQTFCRQCRKESRRILHAKWNCKTTGKHFRAGRKCWNHMTLPWKWRYADWVQNYVESRYGSARNITLYGQEKSGTVWGLCKMNMLFHNIYDSKILNGIPCLILCTKSMVNWKPLTWWLPIRLFRRITATPTWN